MQPMTAPADRLAAWRTRAADLRPHAPRSDRIPTTAGELEAAVREATHETLTPQEAFFPEADDPEQLVRALERIVQFLQLEPGQDSDRRRGRREWRNHAKLAGSGPLLTGFGTQESLVQTQSPRLVTRKPRLTSSSGGASVHRVLSSADRPHALTVLRRRVMNRPHAPDASRSGRRPASPAAFHRSVRPAPFRPVDAGLRTDGDVDAGRSRLRGRRPCGAARRRVYRSFPRRACP